MLYGKLLVHFQREIHMNEVASVNHTELRKMQEIQRQQRGRTYMAMYTMVTILRFFMYFWGCLAIGCKRTESHQNDDYCYPVGNLSRSHTGNCFHYIIHCKKKIH